MTEAKPARPGPRLALSPIELRLYAIAVLAGIHVLVWLLVWRAPVAAPAVAPQARSSPAPAAPQAPQARGTAIWFDELPEALRPAVRPPPGWRLATRGELLERTAATAAAATAAASVPRVVRAPAKRRLRLRTRSS